MCQEGSEQMKENQSIRDRAKATGVKHWEIALHLGISEPTLCRWLRIPLSAEREKMIINAINHLAKGGV